MRKASLFVASLAGVIALANAVPAFAQEADEGASSSDIIVTARRREESIQDVPATVQALSADTLVSRNIQGEWDLPRAVPGLLIRTNNSQNQLNYVIRGESMEPYSGSVPGVQPYVNEVALSGSVPISFFDLENVQVLKGPQGTLFGRNSTGGAVLYRTAKPKGELGGFASVQYGNLDLLNIEGALNVPVAGEAVVLRLAGKYSSGGAFIRNLYNNAKLGDSKLEAGRATLLVNPADGFTNETMVQHDKYSGTNYGRFVFYVEPCGGVGRNFTCFANGSNANFQAFITNGANSTFANYPNGFVYKGGLQNLPDFLRSQGRYTLDQNGPSIYRGKSTVVTNTTTIELSPDITIKNVFGYAKAERDFGYDNDATPFPFLQAGLAPGGTTSLEHQAVRTWSNELQLQGETGRLTWLVGAFYSDQKVLNDSPLVGVGFNPVLNTFPAFAIRYRAQSGDKSTALFAQGTYAVTDQLNVTAGIRQTWDKLRLAQLPGSLFFGPPSNRTKQDDLSWTFSVDYKVTPDIMLYATTRGSWRVGGYNPFVRPPASGANELTAEFSGNYFLPERVRDVEVGAKFSGNAGAMPWRLNVDAYNVWITNSQKTAYTVLAGNITSATVTIPGAKVTGIEADAEISPIEWLRIGGNISYQNARFTDNVAGLYGQTARFGPYADAPKLSGSLFVDITGELPGEGGTLRGHVDLYAQSGFHVSNLGDTFNPGDRLPGYTLVNMRVDWDDPMGAKGLTLSGFIKNLTDKLYFSGGSGAVALYSVNSAIWGQPRTYGLALRAGF